MAPSLGTAIPASSGGFAGSAQGGSEDQAAVGAEGVLMLSQWHCEPGTAGIQSTLLPSWH